MEDTNPNPVTNDGTQAAMEAAPNMDNMEGVVDQGQMQPVDHTAPPPMDAGLHHAPNMPGVDQQPDDAGVGIVHGKYQ